MVDSDCGNARAAAHDAAADLYQIAALMMGDEGEAVDVVESAVAKTNVDPCADPEASVQAARVNLVEAAVTRLSHADPLAFEAPSSAERPGGCIEDDDLTSAGMSAGQLAGMLHGPGRGVLREWLNKLPVAQRAIFVERAVLGWDNARAASSLTRAAARNWQPGQVSDLFRQALCSLANSLVHAAVAEV
jgi:DNA-directed RNA polymerase specialized sigma24 family protein